MHRWALNFAVGACVLALVSFPTFPAWAQEQGASSDRVADQLFGYSYGEAPPASKAGASATETPSGTRSLQSGEDRLELDFRGADGNQFYDTDARRGTLSRQIGIAGTGTGASLLGLGGIVFVGSLFVDKGTTSRTAMKHGGLTLMGLGGAVFITGAVFLIVDMASGDKDKPPVPIPAPTSDGRGAQILFTTRF